jgi:peroxiredoxin
VTLLCSAGRRLSGHIEEFKQENIDVVALSVDPLDKAQEMVERALVPPFPSATG